LTADAISNLTKWLSDLDILQVFRQSRQLACELAEYLNMLMPDSLPINTLQPIVLIELDDDLEISFSPTNIETEIDDEIVEFSEAVRKALSETSDFSNFEQNSDEETDINNEYWVHAELINQNISNISPTSKFKIIISNDFLIINY
jgi:hypothetical protein